MSQIRLELKLADLREP